MMRSESEVRARLEAAEAQRDKWLKRAEETSQKIGTLADYEEYVAVNARDADLLRWVLEPGEPAPKGEE